MGTSIYHYNWNFFTDSERMYYFLGFVAADGYITDNEIEIGVNVQDAYLLEQFRDWIVPGKPIYIKEKTNSVLLKLNCKSRMWSFKSFFGMSTNKKEQEMIFPKNIPEEFVKDFVRGVIDGNGCIDTTKGYKKDKIYIGSRLRILGNQNFLAGLNEATKHFINHNTNAINKKSKANVYCITYNFNTARNILSWVYDNNKICLIRKYQRYLEVTGQDEDIV